MHAARVHCLQVIACMQARMIFTFFHPVRTTLRLRLARPALPAALRVRRRWNRLRSDQWRVWLCAWDGRQTLSGRYHNITHDITVWLCIHLQHARRVVLARAASASASATTGPAASRRAGSANARPAIWARPAVRRWKVIFRQALFFFQRSAVHAERKLAESARANLYLLWRTCSVQSRSACITFGTQYVLDLYIQIHFRPGSGGKTRRFAGFLRTSQQKTETTNLTEWEDDDRKSQNFIFLNSNLAPTLLLCPSYLHLLACFRVTFPVNCPENIFFCLFFRQFLQNHLLLHFIFLNFFL